MATRRVHTRVVPSVPLQGMVYLQRAIVSCSSFEADEITVRSHGLLATGEVVALEAPGRPRCEPPLFRVLQCLPVVVAGEPLYEARLERVEADTVGQSPSSSLPAAATAS